MAFPLLGMLGRGLVGRGGAAAAGGAAGRASVTRTAARNIPRPTRMGRGRRALDMMSGFASNLEPAEQEQSSALDLSKLKLNFTDLINLGTNAKTQIAVSARTFNITGDIKDSIVNVVNPKNMIVRTATMIGAMPGDGGGTIKAESREKDLERRRGLKRFIPRYSGITSKSKSEDSPGFLKTVLGLTLLGTFAPLISQAVIASVGGYIQRKFEENKEAIKTITKTLYTLAVDKIADAVKNLIGSKVDLVKDLIELVKVHVLMPIDSFFGMKTLQRAAGAVQGMLTAIDAGTDATIDMIAEKAKNPFQTAVDVVAGTANVIGDARAATADLAVDVVTSDVGQAFVKSAPKVAEMPNTVWDGFLDLLKATADVPGQIAEQLGFGGSPDVEPAQRSPEAANNTTSSPIIINNQTAPQTPRTSGGGGGILAPRSNEQSELRDAALGNGGMVASPF